MAVKRRSSKRVSRRRAAKVPRAAKRAARRVTRKAARKAKTPKAPKRRRASRKVAKRAAKTPRASKRRRVARKSSKKARRSARKPRIKYGSFRRVWSGTADRTKGGLLKKDLCLNKRGKVVSRKQNAKAKKNFRNSALSKWVVATQKARKELGLVGFVACKKGSAFYKLAKKYYQ